MIHNSSETSPDINSVKYVKNGTQCLRPGEHASKVREQFTGKKKKKKGEGTKPLYFLSASLLAK